MTESAIRFRGLPVVVDTTTPAEWDIKGYQIPDSMVEKIAQNIKAVTFSERDRIVGPVRIRELDGYDVLFIVGRIENQIVITIGRVRPHDPENPTEQILQSLNFVGMFRGATGL